MEKYDVIKLELLFRKKEEKKELKEEEEKETKHEIKQTNNTFFLSFILS